MYYTKKKINVNQYHCEETESSDLNTKEIIAFRYDGLSHAPNSSFFIQSKYFCSYIRIKYNLEEGNQRWREQMNVSNKKKQL